MTQAARTVVIDYLTSGGWTRESEGPSGDLWTRGKAEAVVPRSLEIGSSPWNRLASALALADGESPEDIVQRWQVLLVGTSVEEIPTPRPRLVAGRIEFETHLDGVTVRDHQTSAYHFGRFVMRTSDSVKELVKSSRGVRHQSRDLLVAGGPAEGSVKVTFREPDRADHTAMITDSPETVEGRALVLLASVFAAAEASTDATDADDLRGHLAPLNIRARHGLARLAEAVSDGGWVLTGTIRRGDQEAAVRLGPHAALILSKTSRDAIDQETNEPVSGTLDGWVWSASQLTLITDDRGTIHVNVPMSLQDRVAELNSERDRRVSTTLNIITRVASGTQDRVHTTYSLKSIEPEDQDTLDS
jgi:hypothetical protein